MKTFEQLVYSCLNEAIINPELHVKTNEIIDRLKKFSLPEELSNGYILIDSNKIPISQESRSSYIYMWGNNLNKNINPSVNVADTKKQENYERKRLKELTKPFIYKLMDIKILNVNVQINIVLVPFWIKKYINFPLGSYNAENNEVYIYLTTLPLNQPTNAVKSVNSFLKTSINGVKNTIEHELVHAIEDIKREKKNYQRRPRMFSSGIHGRNDTEKETWKRYRKDVKGYYTTYDPPAGKTPMEFNPKLWELLKAAKEYINQEKIRGPKLELFKVKPPEVYAQKAKDRLLAFLGNYSNQLPYEWGIYSEYLNTIRKNPRLWKNLVKKLAPAIQDIKI